MSDSTEEDGPDAQLYRDIVESLITEIAVFDSAGRYRYVNKRAVADPVVRQWLIGKTNVEYAAWRGTDPKVGAERDAVVQEVLRTGKPHRFEETLTDRSGAVRHFVRSLAPHLLGRGIHLNAVCPGIVDTPMLPDEVRPMLTGAGLALIDPAEIADAVVGCIAGGASGQCLVCQAGQPPEPFEFGRIPGLPF